MKVFKTNHNVKSIAGNVHIMVVMISHVFAVAIAYPVITTVGLRCSTSLPPNPTEHPLNFSDLA